jgi:uncharacterized membrane protein YfcA
VPFDARLLAVGLAIFFGSYCKGVVGLGVPFIATPIIAMLYDLKTAMAIVALPMTLSDFPFVALGIRYLSETRRLLPFILTAVVGMFFGAQLLLVVDQRILMGVLATVIAIFVMTGLFLKLPVLDKRAARIVGPPFGFIAGVIQGSAGLSGPLATIYLLSLDVPRHLFMFAINAIFQVLDATQFLALRSVGLYTPGLTNLAVACILPMSIGVWLGFKTQKYVNDVVFRRVVLIVLALSSANLYARVIALS